MNNPAHKNALRSSMRIRAKWQQHITAPQASGLTQAAYCREHGLDAKYLSLWKSKLAKPDAIATTTAEKVRTALISVIVKPATEAAAESAKSVPAIVPTVARSSGSGLLFSDGTLQGQQNKSAHVYYVSAQQRAK